MIPGLMIPQMPGMPQQNGFNNIPFGFPPGLTPSFGAT
jgi:hypothetical protein